MATTSSSDSLAMSSVFPNYVSHFLTFLAIYVVVALCKSSMPAGLLQKEQICSIECGPADHVCTVCVLVLDCCSETDSALLSWRTFFC